MRLSTLTYILSCTVSKLWLFIGQIFACDSRRPHFNALAVGDALRISGWSLPLQKLIVLPDSENRMIVSSFIWTKHRNVTEGQTNGQTDRKAMAITARHALQAMRTRCKNYGTERICMKILPQMYLCTRKNWLILGVICLRIRIQDFCRILQHCEIGHFVTMWLISPERVIEFWWEFYHRCILEQGSPR